MGAALCLSLRCVTSYNTPHTIPPSQVLQSYATHVYFPFQDQGRVPLWFEPWLHSAQRTHKRWAAARASPPFKPGSACSGCLRLPCCCMLSASLVKCATSSPLSKTQARD